MQFARLLLFGDSHRRLLFDHFFHVGVGTVGTVGSHVGAVGSHVRSVFLLRGKHFALVHICHGIDERFDFVIRHGRDVLLIQVQSMMDEQRRDIVYLKSQGKPSPAQLYNPLCLSVN